MPNGSSPSLAGRLVSATFIALSPVVLYFGVTRLSVGVGAAVVAGWIVIRSVPTLLLTSRENLLPTLKLPLVGLIFALLGALTREPRLLLVLPSATQFGFAWVFVDSLRTTPMIERFARIQDPSLTAQEIGYCRAVTVVWSVFLVACGALGLLLAWLSTAEVWGFFTGVGSYVLIALLFAGEYVFRQFHLPGHRFRDARRVYRRLFPLRG